MPFTAGQAVYDVSRPGGGLGRLTGRHQTRAGILYWEVVLAHTNGDSFRSRI